MDNQTPPEDSDRYAAELQEMHNLQNQTSSWSGVVMMLVVSMALFVGTGSASWSLEHATTLILLMLLHESGHFVAMKLSGYRNLKMFFIPFFGGVFLERSLDTFMAAAKGLHFGRFDLRAPSDREFQEGRGLRILELNGVTGEPAHVYNPGYPYWRGVADLCSHWRAACATGVSNMAHGHEASTVRSMWKLIVDVRRRAAFEAPSARP